MLLLVQVSSTISHNKFFDYFDKCGKITLIICLVLDPAMSVMRTLSFKLIPINMISVIPLSLVLIVIVWYISIWLRNLQLYPRKRYISGYEDKVEWVVVEMKNYEFI